MRKQVMRLERDSFSLCNSEDKELFILAFFLTGDVAGNTEAKFYREWLDDPNRKGSGGNSSDLKKIGDFINVKEYPRILNLRMNFSLIELSA